MQTVENNRLSHCEFWDEFCRDFHEHASHLDTLNMWTSSALFKLHSQLLLYNEYQHSLKMISTETIKNHNLVIPLFTDDIFRVNLIAITPECSLPLHNHPGSSGAMMVISGNVRGIVCEQVDPVTTKKQMRSMLKVVENKIFIPNETSCFTKKQNNIHSIKALTNRAVALVFHTPPFSTNQQSYFFSATPLQKTGTHVVTQRIQAYAFQKLRQSKLDHLRELAK